MTSGIFYKNLIIINKPRSAILELINSTRQYFNSHVIFTDNYEIYEPLNKVPLSKKTNGQDKESKIFLNNIRLSDVVVSKILEKQSLMVKGQIISNNTNILRQIYNKSITYRKIKPHPGVEEIMEVLRAALAESATEDVAEEEKKLRANYLNDLADEKLLPLYREHILTHQRFLRTIRYAATPDEMLEAVKEPAEANAEEKHAKEPAEEKPIKAPVEAPADEEKPVEVSAEASKISRSRRRRMKLKQKKVQNTPSVSEENQTAAAHENKKSDDAPTRMNKSQRKKANKKARLQHEKNNPEFSIAIDYIDINPHIMLIVDNPIETEKLTSIVNYNREFMITFVLFVEKKEDIPTGYAGYFDLYEGLN